MTRPFLSVHRSLLYRGDAFGSNINSEHQKTVAYSWQNAVTTVMPYYTAIACVLASLCNHCCYTRYLLRVYDTHSAIWLLLRGNADKITQVRLWSVWKLCDDVLAFSHSRQKSGQTNGHDNGAVYIERECTGCQSRCCCCCRCCNLMNCCKYIVSVCELTVITIFL